MTPRLPVFLRGRTFVLVLACLAVGLVLAQRSQRWRGGGRGWFPEDSYRTARSVPSHSTDTPAWTNAPGFEKDVFTFVRVVYDRHPYAVRSAGFWATDLPDSDLNLSYRLQQMTSLKVDPDGRLLRLTNPELFDYPFIYIVEPGGLSLSPEEARILQRYLLNGGFLMLDDFWGEAEWRNVEREFHQVFPDRTFVELPLDDPLYRCVFQIKSKAQVPNIGLGVSSQEDGVTWERPDAEEVHHRVIRDDRDRIMVIATHNTDNGDGWEREGENEYYFRTFSERVAYPLGINIIVYAMTH